MKIKYNDLQKEEVTNLVELSIWQKQILDGRLNDYYQNPENINNLSKTIEDIERTL